MSRKIKDIKDKHTGELVYPRTHASAVAMSSDSTLEDLVEVVNAKQDKLVSGTNIKTINGESILGNGDITAVESRILEFTTSGELTEDQLNNNIEIYNKILNHENIIVYESAKAGRPMYPLYIQSFDNSIITFVDSVKDSHYSSFGLNSAGYVELMSFINQHTPFDEYLSTTSTNAVQNKVVTTELAKKGTYSKPSNGIPKSDLASAVQTSLEKADTALQSYTEQYKGTVTGVKINGITKNPSSGVVDLGTVSVPTPVVSVSTTSQSIEPNKYYKWSSARSTLTITLATPKDTSILNNYMFEFPTSTSGCTLSVPSGIKWANGEVPVFEPNMTYQVSIINNLAVVTKFV